MAPSLFTNPLRLHFFKGFHEFFLSKPDGVFPKLAAFPYPRCCTLLCCLILLLFQPLFSTSKAKDAPPVAYAQIASEATIPGKTDRPFISLAQNWHYLIYYPNWVSFFECNNLVVYGLTLYSNHLRSLQTHCHYGDAMLPSVICFAYSIYKSCCIS
jgi:hypothetical protein